MYEGGYTGHTLWIDLSEKEARIESTDAELAELYLGGAGFGVKLLYDLVAPDIDPLGPGNVLVFAPGPLTGTPSPCSSRITVTSRSPQTGAVAMSVSGGIFPAAVKRAGFDAIVIQGRAATPTYLAVKDDEVFFRSANRLWGTNTFDCQFFLKEELGDQNYRIACIGPAGEKKSLMAGIFNERRAMGRKGVGAAMGAKQLKAIAVLGTREVPIADSKRFDASRRELLRRFRSSKTLYPGLGHYGTSDAVDITCEKGIFPARNFRDTGLFCPLDKIGYEIQDEDTIRRNPCYNCPVGCSQVRKAQSGKYRGVLTEGPEFETTGSFGGFTGVSDLSAVYLADRLCDEYGLDTISVGSTIAFAMELFEEEIISVEDTDGLELRFGNPEAMIEMVHHIGRREGFGAVLADGAVRAAREIGHGSEAYVMHVKGLELPAYDVRGAVAQGLNYMTAYTGADHNRGYSAQEIFGSPIPVAVDRFALEGKPELTKWNQVVEVALCDCPTFCSFLFSNADAFLRATEEGMSRDLTERRIGNVVDLLNAATGMEWSPGELIRVGERINVLARCFNLREGFSREDDYLPARLTTEPIPAGASEGRRLSREDQDWLLDRYYDLYGYDCRGVPTRSRLRELELAEVAEDLAQLGLNPRP
jgi:aldehyde:ferredoxin oxidoreductase